MTLAPRPRLPIGLLGMLALIVCVEGFLTRHELTLRHPWGWDWFLAERAARVKVKDCEILCFGDSLMKFGISPQMITQRTGLKSYNLAVGAGEVPGSYFLFRRAIDAGARPKAVLMDAAPHMLSKKVHASLLWPEVLSYRDCADLALNAGDADFLASMATSKLLPSVRDRSEIRKAVMASLRGVPPSMSDLLFPSHLRNWKVNRGAQMTNPSPNPPENLIPAMAYELLPETWKPDRVVVHYVHEFLNLADQRGIQVYWLIAPLLPEVQARRDAMGLDAKYMAFMHDVQAQHPSMIILDASHSGYGNPEHVDPVHLDTRGALCLSRDVAAMLGRNPATVSRWERLPAFRDLPAEVHVEDLNESIVAVTARVIK